MSIINRGSTMYAVISGEHKGKKCVVRSLGDGGLVGVIDVDGPDGNKILFVKRGELAQLELPGWADTFADVHPCKLEAYLERDRIGDAIRDTFISQPVLLAMGDNLATGEIVVEAPRRGFNSTILIHLDKTGWVELAYRLPIALKGNDNFKLPVELTENDRLATNCLIVKSPYSTKTNWTNIYLNRESCCIDVPSCIPLALA